MGVDGLKPDALGEFVDEVTTLVHEAKREELRELLKSLIFIGMFDSDFADEILTSR